jgi:hypothetical protein
MPNQDLLSKENYKPSFFGGLTFEKAKELFVEEEYIFNEDHAVCIECGREYNYIRTYLTVECMGKLECQITCCGVDNV